MKTIQASGENFILSFVGKDGIVYPVALNEEQKQVFNILLGSIPGTIQVAKEPVGRIMTLKEFKEMKEGK